MDWTFNGMPLHPLLVHAAVVFVPATSLAMILVALWPAMQKKLGLVVPVMATISTFTVLLTIQAGEELEESTEASALLEAHTTAADGLLPWIVLMLVAAWAQWGVYRFVLQRKDPAGAPAVGGARRKVIAVAMAAIAVFAASAAAWEVYVVADAGAKSVWDESAE